MAINELIKCAGKQFDPQVVDAFLTALDKSELSKEELLHWKLDTIRDIYRDVIMAVTQCQLILADDEELTDILKTGEIKLEVFIRNNSDAPIVRKNVERVLEELTVDPKIQKNLLLCVSEVISNMLKHAQGGAMQIIVSPRKIWFIAKDRGEGIKLRDIPKATLKKGFSTKKSLGMGFSIMLELLDRVYLKTDEHGTTVVLEQKRF
jgi:anti-sigma regulatory factor (Ser/Thr protein kinase)